MKTTVSLFALMSVLAPVVAGAQIVPPPAPVAPVPPVPRVAPLPMPAPVIIPELADALIIDTQALRERAMAEARIMSADQVRELTDRARQQAELARLSKEDMQALAERARLQAEEMHLTYAFERDLEQTMAAGFGQTWASGDNERSYYDRGQSALQQRQYEQAITRFDQAIAAKGTRTDGALYWKAFAQFKLGRSADANATLATLQQNHKDSKYLSDAKALEADIKRKAGQPARPENEDDEDLKLLALQGLINSDPERAVPLVQGVLASAGSLKLKERALFVLAQSNSAQAHAILVNTAKNGTPDLQSKAINYLGFSRGREGGKTTTAELMDIYNASQNDDVKRAIIRAFGSSGDRAALVSVISGTTVNTLRNEAVNQLGSAQGQAELLALYQKETNKELRMQILSTLGSMGAYDPIINVAKTERDAELRSRAIRSLGYMRAERSGQALIDIYGTLTEVADKKAVISGLANQNNAEALIAIARKETTWELKKTIVERLTNMPKNKAAQDYLMEIIK